MKIVIEGAKGTGKSTLANKLNEFTGAAVYHASSETDNTIGWHTRQLMSGEDMILDRFQIGEIVYSMFYNRKPKILIREMFMMPSLAPDSMFVILYSRFDKIPIERMRKREAEKGRTVTNREIKESRFANSHFKHIGELMQLEHDNVILIDIVGKTADEIFEEVKHEGRKRNIWF